MQLQLIIGILQTHTKKNKPSYAGSPSSEEVILAAVEPPPFGTNHAVCKQLYLGSDQKAGS